MKILACAKPVIVVNRARREHRKELNCADCIYSKNAKVCTLFPKIIFTSIPFIVEVILIYVDHTLIFLRLKNNYILRNRSSLGNNPVKC